MRKVTGIRRRRGGWRVSVRVLGRLHSKQYPLTTPVQEMKDWRDDQVERFGGERLTTGSFGADIVVYLGRVAAMPSYKQRAAHLELWAQALGRDRPRRTITAEEIDVVLQGWLETLAPGTVRKRRTALQSFFGKMNGKKSRLVNPVKGSDNPKEPKPEARGLDYPALERALAAMPDQRDTKKGLPRRVNKSKIRARVIAYTGIPPGLVKTIRPHDLQLAAATVRIVPRSKGGGVEARTLPLIPEALAAFTDFHPAQCYGPFATESLNRSFKRGCRRAGVDPKTVHLYDLRHSFLSQVYRVTRDLATVGRLGLHAEGSPVTARYAKGANREVDVAATVAFEAALLEQRRLAGAAGESDQAPPRETRRGTLGPRMVSFGTIRDRKRRRAAATKRRKS
jgi:integrase